jgi:hypothetical protein
MALYYYNVIWLLHQEPEMLKKIYNSIVGTIMTTLIDWKRCVMCDVCLKW